MLSLLALETAVDLWLAADRGAVWEKSRRLWDLFEAQTRRLRDEHGFGLLTPAAEEQRGSHIAFSHPVGWAIIQALIDKNVIGDFREPDVLRFGLTPLYEVMDGGLWRNAPARAAGRVT